MVGPPSEFAAVGSYLADPTEIFLSKDSGVTYTTLVEFRDRIDEWRSYFKSDPMWCKGHATQISPLASLFRGAYTSLELHPWHEGTKGRYVEMLAQLGEKGELVTESFTYEG